MTSGAKAGSEFDKVEAATDALRAHITVPPRVALVLGSGLGNLADELEQPHAVQYSKIPYFPRSTVEGHAGRLVFGGLEGVPLVVMQGRFHLYEGYSPQEVVRPIRVMRRLGAEMLFVTNAAGGLNPAHAAGDLMAIADHIGLPIMTGLNPLLGPNDERFGPRFPAMTTAYDAHLRQLASDVADEQGIRLHSGVYAMLSGPNYETPAELRFFRLIGADAVGMSTVPEVIAARHMGMRILAVSCITNVALGSDGLNTPEAAHADVLATAALASTRLTAIIRGVLRRVADAKVGATPQP